MVRSEVFTKKTGKTTTETRFYLSSLEPAERTSEQWQELIRGHWAGVEIRNHWRRDTFWGEDGSRTRKPNALGNLALLRSALLALLSVPEGHYQVKLDASARERFTVWMDTYAQRLGSFSPDQERRLEDLRRACADLLTDPVPATHAAAGQRPLSTASLGGRN